MEDLSGREPPPEDISERKGSPGEKNSPGKEPEMRFRFCLCINGSPGYSFGDLDTAKKFQQKMMKSRERLYRRYKYQIRLENGLENEGVRILGVHWVLGVFPIFRTLEKLEIFETVQVAMSNFPEFPDLKKNEKMFLI